MGYDATGNVTSVTRDGMQRALTWNARYELVEVSTNGTVAERYEYDALGRRTRILAAGVTNTLVHDGAQVVADYENGVLKRTYTWGPGLDNPLSFTTHARDCGTVWSPNRLRKQPHKPF